MSFWSLGIGAVKGKMTSVALSHAFCVFLFLLKRKIHINAFLSIRRVDLAERLPPTHSCYYFAENYFYNPKN